MKTKAKPKASAKSLTLTEVLGIANITADWQVQMGKDNVVLGTKGNVVVQLIKKVHTPVNQKPFTEYIAYATTGIYEGVFQLGLHVNQDEQNTEIKAAYEQAMEKAVKVELFADKTANPRKESALEEARELLRKGNTGQDIERQVETRARFYGGNSE